MKYITVTAEELSHLREGLQVIESLNEYDERVAEIYFYGLTDNSVALNAVKEAVAYWAEGEIDEADVNVTEAVFAFPVSADVLYYLTGSGFMVRDGEAIYTSGGGEGPRTVNLAIRQGRQGGTKMTVGEFKTMALSRDEFSGEEFLIQYGTGTHAPAPQEVQRTEPAREQAQKPVATTPGREGVAPAKKSSLRFNVEEWLR